MASGNIPGSRTSRKRTNRAYYTNHLARMIATIKRLIIRVWWSIDTVQILTAKPITDAHYHALQALAGEVIWPWRYKGYPPLYGIRLHRPSAAALAYLARRFPDHIVTRFDIAVDFHCASPADAAIVRVLLRLTVTQPWRGDRLTGTCETTVYWGDKWDKRNIALYPKSATTARLELRYFTAKACRQRAVAQATDVLNWDLAKFFPRDVRFSVVNWEKAEQLIADAARKMEADSQRRRQRKFKFSYWDDRDRLRGWLEHRVCRMVSDDEFEPIPAWDDRATFPAQHCLDALPFLADALHHQTTAPLINVAECSQRLHPVEIAA